MEELLLRLMKLNIDVRVDNGNLRLNVPKDFQATEILQEIKAKKAQLIDYINERNASMRVARGVDKAPEKEHYPLSSAQKRLYFIYELDPSSVLYTIQHAIRLIGRVDRTRLVEVFRTLINRHEILRTSFVRVGGELMQKVIDAVPFDIESYTAGAGDEKAIVDRFVRPFDLSDSPLMRVALIGKSAEEHVLIVDVHHIAMDGVSMGILIDEFVRLYRGEVLSPLRLQYKDYAEWEQGSAQQAEMNRQKNFWLKEFASDVDVLELPVDFSRREMSRHDGRHFDFELKEGQTEKLAALAQREGVTLFPLLLALYNILLSKLSNQEDIVIGSPVTGRQHNDLDNIVGMFVNTIPLRNFPKGDLRFVDFLGDVRTRLLACLENKDYPYEDLVNALNPERDVNRNPLFDTMFTFQSAEKSLLALPELRFEPYAYSSGVSKFDLTFSARQDGNRLFLSFEYAVALFTSETIQRFAAYFVQLVGLVTDDAAMKLSHIELLTEGERSQLLHDFNSTSVVYEKKATLLSLFERRCKETPNNLAVVFQDERLTYKALNHQANITASRIKSKIDASQGTRIGIMADAAVDMVVGMLAILKVGGVYVPLSPDVPQARNAYVYKDCGARLVLVQGSIMANRPDAVAFLGDENIVAIGSGSDALEEIEDVSSAVVADDSVYIIYTSGTTGDPKGVEVTHRGLVNTLESYKRLFPVNQSTRMSQVAHVCFDAAAFEIWPAIIYGGGLYIAPRDMRTDPVQMKQWLFDNRIEITFQPTVIGEMLLQARWDDATCFLKVMSVAGDTLRYVPKEDLPFKLYNLYGPTEDSIWTTWTEVKPGNESGGYCIGKPIGNKKVYILDKHSHLRPVGVPGELCIAGSGLAKGYVNREALTREKFIDNPYEPGKKIYKTGDLARWTADGFLEFLGRVDSQVKIRGFRVELGEIEKHLSSHEGIEECIAVIKEMPTGKQIVAYYVAAEEIPSTALRHLLLNRLPNYMVPLYYVRLTHIPITTGGKLDVKALPEPKVGIREDYVGPSNSVEEKLVAIWSKVLNLDKQAISVNESFFDLGGHSLIAPILIASISSELNVSFHLNTLFQYQTISALSGYIADNLVVEQTYS